jgi:sorbitol-specific phosphotransferase system component IIC
MNRQAQVIALAVNALPVMATIISFTEPMTRAFGRGDFLESRIKTAVTGTGSP